MKKDEVKIDSNPEWTAAHDLTHDLTPPLLHDQLEHGLQCLSHDIRCREHVILIDYMYVSE